MELKVSYEKLQEVLNFEAQKTVGEVLKRVDIVDNKNYLKKILKELIYERYRDFRDMLVAIGLGLPGLSIHVSVNKDCLLYTSPSPRDLSTSRMPSSA